MNECRKEDSQETDIQESNIYEWFSRFKIGQMSIEDEPRPGRPLTSKTDENIEKIRVAIMFDRRRTCLLYTSRCV